MQYIQTSLMLMLLCGLPNIAFAETFTQAPFWILGSGVVLLLALSAYVTVKIIQNLKQDLKKPAK